MLKKTKTGLGIFLISVFILKMLVAAVPVLLDINKTKINAAVLQLELDTKTDKEDPGKDLLKEKKFFDEYLTFLFEFKAFVAESDLLRNSENTLYTQLYHPTVPTPPPTFNCYFPQ